MGSRCLLISSVVEYCKCCMYSLSIFSLLLLLVLIPPEFPQFVLPVCLSLTLSSLSFTILSLILSCCFLSILLNYYSHCPYQPLHFLSLTLSSTPLYTLTLSLLSASSLFLSTPSFFTLSLSSLSYFILLLLFIFLSPLSSFIQVSLCM